MPTSDDAAVVAAMTAGDPSGLDRAYRRYADRLYTYARSLVDDREAAADVVQETFLIAQERASQLRDPSRLSAWLYTIARNECLRRIKARKRTVALADSHEPVSGTDPGRAIQAAEVRELVYAAAAGLTDSDREVFELTIRHGLAAGDVAGVLGVSANHAHARVSRARTQFEAALGALLLARDPGRDCADLGELLQGWDGQLSALLRKRIERHTRDCLRCIERRRDRMNPTSLLAAFSAVPFLAIGMPLRGTGGPPMGGRSTPDVQSRLDGQATPGGQPPGGSAPSAPATPIGQTPPGPATPVGQAPPGPATPIGMGGPDRSLSSGQPATPPTSSRSRGRRGRSIALGTAAAAILAAVLIVPRACSTLDEVATAEEPAASAAAPAAPEPNLTQPTPVSTPSQGPTPAVPSGTPAPAAFTADAVARATCTGGGRFDLITGVEARGATLSTARLYWRTKPSTPGGLTTLASVAMTVSGATARHTLDLTTSAVTWWVVATAADGRTVTTPQVVTDNPCP